VPSWTVTVTVFPAASVAVSSSEPTAAVHDWIVRARCSDPMNMSMADGSEVPLVVVVSPTAVGSDDAAAVVVELVVTFAEVAVVDDEASSTSSPQPAISSARNTATTIADTRVQEFDRIDDRMEVMGSRYSSRSTRWDSTGASESGTKRGVELDPCDADLLGQLARCGDLPVLTGLHNPAGRQIPTSGPHVLAHAAPRLLPSGQSHRGRWEGTVRVVAVGVYPGSFDPLTIAHLAVADAARVHLDLDRLDLAISRSALGKEHLGADSIHRRLARARSVLGDRPWLRVIVVEARLVADVAEGYDVVVMGADKWAQVLDPRWYGDDESSRDAALARLPRVAVAPRDGHFAPADLLLPVTAEFGRVSSSAVRAGRTEWAAAPLGERPT